MNELETSSIEEIRHLQERIVENAHKAVLDAERIGQILKEVRERVPGTDIGQWAESNCGITKSTAYRYMQLFEYRYKIPTVGNLQEAYTQISCLTKKEKEEENKNASSRIEEYKKTGIKPEGWRRGTDDKLANKNEEINDEKMKKMTDEFYGYVQKSIDRLTKQNEWFEKFRVSDISKDSPVTSALIQYLDELDNDNERIAACNDIIKLCKGIAIELQGKISGGRHE